MNLAYIANIRLPTEKAHGYQIMKMCEFFSKAGVQTKLFVPTRFNKLKVNPFDFYGVKNNFFIKKIFSFDLVRLSGNHIFYLKQLFSFLLFCRIYLAFKKFDILYTREIFAGLFFNNFVLELHDLSSGPLWVKKIAYKKAKKIVVLTKYIKEEIEKDFPEFSQKIIIAPDGVDLGEFENLPNKVEARKIFNLPLDKKIIVYTGSLLPWKGIETVLGALKSFGGDFLFVFVSGNSYDAKKYQKEDFNLKNTRFISNADNKILTQILRAADLLLLPNSGKEKISKFYTSPLKLFKYMASGVPIVASDLPSLGEILNENNAWLFKADDATDLENVIKAALEKSDGSKEKASRALRDVQKYGWNERVSEILHSIA